VRSAPARGRSIPGDRPTRMRGPLSGCRRQFLLGLRQPERHPHLAQHRDRRGELDAGLVPASRAAVQIAEVAVGLSASARPRHRSRRTAPRSASRRRPGGSRPPGSSGIGCRRAGSPGPARPGWRSPRTAALDPGGPPRRCPRCTRRRGCPRWCAAPAAAAPPSSASVSLPCSPADRPGRGRPWPSP
jgi:hypothetical protein